MAKSSEEPRTTRFLGVSLYLKLVTAATLLIVGATAAGAVVARGGPVPGLNGWLAVGVIIVAGANALLVHLALRPLRAMASVVRRVEEGDEDARVPISALADQDMIRMVQVVNRMLDALDRARARERSLAMRIAEVEEMERKRLSHELLDGPAQLLSSVLMRIGAASRTLPDDEGTTPARSALEEARREAKTALGEIGQVARGLRPPELDELGPSRAIEIQARHLTRGLPIRIRIDGDDIDAHVDPTRSLALYRILREGIANAVRHGNPASIRIRYRVTAERIVAEVEDDGTGFDAAAWASRPEKHPGLLRMHERARHAGGRLAIESTPGMGTRVRLELPRDPSKGPVRSMG